MYTLSIMRLKAPFATTPKRVRRQGRECHPTSISCRDMMCLCVFARSIQSEVITEKPIDMVFRSKQFDRKYRGNQRDILTHGVNDTLTKHNCIVMINSLPNKRSSKINVSPLSGRLYSYIFKIIINEFYLCVVSLCSIRTAPPPPPTAPYAVCLS